MSGVALPPIAGSSSVSQISGGAPQSSAFGSQYRGRVDDLPAAGLSSVRTRNNGGTGIGFSITNPSAGLFPGRNSFVARAQTYQRGYQPSSVMDLPAYGSALPFEKQVAPAPVAPIVGSSKRRINTPGKDTAYVRNSDEVGMRRKLETPGKFSSDLPHGDLKSKRRVRTPGRNSESVDLTLGAMKRRVETPHGKEESEVRVLKTVVPVQHPDSHVTRRALNTDIPTFQAARNDNTSVAKEMLLSQRRRHYTRGGSLSHATKTTTEPEFQFGKGVGAANPRGTDLSLDRCGAEFNFVGMSSKRKVADAHGNVLHPSSQDTKPTLDDPARPLMRSTKGNKPLDKTSLVPELRTSPDEQFVGSLKHHIPNPHKIPEDKPIGRARNNAVHVSTQSHNPHEIPKMYPEGHSMYGKIHPMYINATSYYARNMPPLPGASPLVANKTHRLW
eukprot:gnl/Spiro4/28536_TR14105_c0_g1_i1.p1 gnl/Spiro4/28536_TR14105_c0_g1~~gnl/Spiro4/28536_TR14105_c0_g1_i1.p1  ORF type:complete len:469 (+),score=58.68 gnl/Spiro4/28536_TR14105_c0_g1_i1:76-1407(+)